MKSKKKLEKIRKEKEKIDKISNKIRSERKSKKFTDKYSKLFLKKKTEKTKSEQKNSLKSPDEKKRKNLRFFPKGFKGKTKTKVLGFGVSKKSIDKKKKKIANAKKLYNDAKEKEEKRKNKRSKKKLEKKKEKKKKTPLKKKKRKSTYEQKKFFSSFIQKAGIESNFREINKIIAGITVSIIVLMTIFLVIKFIVNRTFLSYAFGFLLPIWLFGTVGIFLILWLAFFLYIDLMIYKRKKEIEAVFPDFLQLTSANINAGMPIDKSLWYAIRPRFGILAKEMESVAKSTMVGEKLDKALLDFSDKYESVQVRRSLNLLLEGIRSGSELGDLLSRVATNMRETEIVKKEMASNVTTYIIFILFSTLGAAPFLFGLTTELIVIMNSIFSNIRIGEGGQSFGGVGNLLIGTGNSISLRDYQIFAATSVVIASVFSAIIISVIQKGNVKEAFKKIPLYILIGLTNYFISFNILHYALGGMF